MKIDKKTDNLMVLKELNLLAIVFGIIIAFVGIYLLINPSASAQPMPLWLSLLFLAIGLAVILFVKIITITIDKTSNKLSIKRQGLLGTSLEEYILTQIKGIQLFQSVKYTRDSKGRQRRMLVTNLSFILEGGEQVLLTSSSVGGLGVWNFFGSPNITNEEKIGKDISTFLGVPFQVQRPLTTGELLSTVKGAIEEGMAKSKSEQPK